MEKKKVFIIDGYGQIFRSYYAFMQNPLTDRNGNNVSAVFGFFVTVMSLIRQYQPDYFVVALDSKGKTFRHEMYPLYKANRAKTPEDLHAQVDMIKTIMDKIHMANFSKQGMEADDIIATITKNSTELGFESVMVTGDKDLLQLVNDSVFALRPPRKGEHEYRLCKDKEVLELFGVRPDQIIDYLTILGDSSDNVPGIAGIGEKGAVKLLTDFGTLDSIYDNVMSVSSSLQTKLLNAKDSIELSRNLIKLKDDIFDASEIDLAYFDTHNINWEEAVRLFNNLGSSKLVNHAKNMLPKGTVVSLSSLEETEKNETNVISCENIDINLDDPEKLIGFDLKEKIKQYKKKGIEAKAYFDISLAAWMIDSNSSRYSLNDLKEKYLDPSYDDIEATKKLYFILSDKLEKSNLRELYDSLENPLISILAEMEDQGIKLDILKLKEFEKSLSEQCLEIEKDIYTICGHPFNLNSPKQLQEVLFVERDLPTSKKTATGFSTDSDVLEELSNTTEDPIPPLILRYRTLTKLSSVYTQALYDLADSDTRIHTSFLQTGTATGRLSSKNPNLQNIPVRTEEGRKIRDAFVSKSGYTLLSADYSQIELAVLAHLSQDKELCSSFINADDVHRKTASLIFNVFEELVTPEQRRIAKTINFGVIYGMSAFRLSQDLKISRKEASSFIDTYFERYSQVSSFIEKTKQEALEKGYVQTALGHKREVPEIKSVNKNIKAQGERIAVNTVVQGTAAEIVKLAMISISKEIKKHGYDAKLLLQVHDEVILEVKNECLEEVKELVRTCMENAMKLSVPLRVGIETGVSWGLFH